jgi:RNA polymerase sigma-B factor
MPRSSQVSDRDLLRAYHEQGDAAAREELIERHLPLVRALALRYSGRGEQLDDLVQVGSIGLIKAIDRFELDRGVQLTTYAIPTIVGEIKRYFRDRTWSVSVPRRLKDLNLTISRLLEELTAQLGRSPSVAEIAEAAHVGEEDVVEALESGRAYSTVLPPTQAREEENEAGPDPIDTLGSIDHGFEVSEDRLALSSGIHVLSKRERRILHLRFFEGLTQSQIAHEIGISQMHVSRLIRQAIEKLRDAIEETDT